MHFLNEHTSKRTGIYILVLLFFYACTKPNEEVASGPMSALIRPDHFPPAHYTFTNNPYTEKGFELGKSLFFDPILSVDSTISCASCHHQRYAFSDMGKQYSTGVNGLHASRNSPPVFNMAWNRSFMWDGGVNHIEIMPFAPIINPAEMGEELNNVIRKLRDHPSYPEQFRKAFGQNELTDQQMFWALAQYMGNLVSASSRYDKYLKQEVTLNEQEMNGLILFEQHCATCHEMPLFTDQLFHNNGLDTIFNDVGRFRISMDSTDLGAFKTPTLRNIALTAPYMHDGRFQTLDDVLDHYRSGVLSSNSLSPQLTAGGIPLTDQEAQDIISFLHTLTDHEFINDPLLVP